MTGTLIDKLEALLKREQAVYKQTPSPYNEGWVDGCEETIKMVKAHHASGEISASSTLIDCRTAFEAKAYHSYSIRKREDGHYEDRDTEAAWCGWRSAWQHLGGPQLNIQKIGFTCERTGKRYEFKGMTAMIMAFLEQTKQLDKLQSSEISVLNDEVHAVCSDADWITLNAHDFPSVVERARNILRVMNKISSSPKREQGEIPYVTGGVQAGIMNALITSENNKRREAVLNEEDLAHRVSTALSKNIEFEHVDCELNCDDLTVAVCNAIEPHLRAIHDNGYRNGTLQEQAIQFSTKRESVNPTEEMCDAVRWFILARDAGIFTWGGLERSGRPSTTDYIEQQIKADPKGHITKWDFAQCVYLLMNTKIEAEPKRETGSLLRPASTKGPTECNCRPGVCLAPRPSWCKDPDKANATQEANPTEIEGDI